MENKEMYIDTKIDQKISSTTFYWTFGILISATIAIVGGVFVYCEKINDISRDHAHRLTIIETKILEREK